MVTARLLAGAVFGLCATVGASPTYFASETANDIDGLDSGVLPILTPSDAPSAGQSLVIDDSLDAPLPLVDIRNLVVSSEARDDGPVAFSVPGVIEISAIDDPNGDLISSLAPSPDASRRGWFSENAPNATITRIGLASAAGYQDARGLLQVTPSIAVIPLPGALISGMATLAMIGIGYATSRLRKRR